MFRLLPKSSGCLFVSIDLREEIEKWNKKLHDEIQQFDSDRLLNTAPVDLATYFEKKYAVEVPKLRRSEWVADECEIRVDVSKDEYRGINDRNQPFYIPGQRIKVEVPFDGDPDLFYARPSSFSTTVPYAKVQGQSLLLVLEIAHDVQRDLQSEINRTLHEIEQYLGSVRNDVTSFNNGLSSVALTAIENRRQRILANRGRVAALGIPLKTRADSPKTYSVPSVRRKVVPTLPPASSVPYEPEPTLDMENYEYILNVVQNMVQVMERSPSAFETMEEEHLRQHFLVQLNGHFEGNATGETFNFGGKTDILLRFNGRNIFIAECKFWAGPKKHLDTVGQLLDYTAWRDTKTAILVFNRDTNMTTVLSGIKSVMESHPNYKRTIDWKHETGFRYAFHHNNDVNRELVLTVLVFDVPSTL